MTCGSAKESMVSVWCGDVDRATETMLREHMDTCEACRLEMSELSGLWERLGDLPVPEASHAMRQRWQAGTVGRSLSPARLSMRWWQTAIAAGCLLAGLLIGSRWQNNSDEIARLRLEVASTKELVTLSLLREHSAAERLRGVDYTTRMPAMDPQVTNALVQAVSQDDNVNVRLAAIDALTRISGDASVRQSMAAALTTQESPMVQAALIDYLVEARDRQAVPVIQQLATRTDLDPSVRKRAQTALGQLVN